jgi:serine/threonine-protein kinase
VELSCRSESDELPAGTSVGEYRIERTIATGGMGTVYAAVHPIIGKRAAIKVIAPWLSGDREAVDRFLLEARSVNAIGDPNVVDVFGFGTLGDGRVYLVMEWLVGETLAARCRAGLLGLPEVVHIVKTVARTLERVHACGFIHRDLKPDNVFLTSRREVTNVMWPYDVKLLDFGIAKLVARESPSSQLTRTGIVIGTPGYVSPEQARGAPVGAATDVYSLGVVAYELLAGTPPFHQGSPVEVMAQHIVEQPAPPRTLRPDIPPVLDSLILQMLAKKPEDRPSLLECRRRLEAAVDRSPSREAMMATAIVTSLPYQPVARPTFTPPPGPTVPPRGGLLKVIGVGAAFMFAAVLLGAALLHDGGVEPPVDAPDLPPMASEAAAAPSADAAPTPPDVVVDEPVDESPPPRRRRARRPETHRPIHLR